MVLTTLADDEYGGDTNGDADATAPVTGSGWTQLLFSTASVLSTVEHVIVRYAGVVFNSPVRVTSAAMVTMRHIRAEYGMGAGPHVSSHVGDAAGWVAFANTGPGIRLTGGSFALVHATSVERLPLPHLRLRSGGGGHRSADLVKAYAIRATETDEVGS